MELSEGDRIRYEVTFLDMEGNPKIDALKMPKDTSVKVLLVQNSSVPQFLNLYQVVGSEYEWTDLLDCSRKKLEEFICNKNVRIFVLEQSKKLAGFFVLDNREESICDIAYFGLVPEAIGRGLGTYLLQYALKNAWDTVGVSKVTVNTNSLDHPRALPLYKKFGFKLYKKEIHSRILTKPNFQVKIKPLVQGE